ncbi:MAG: hypothetical protein ACHQLA_00245 [Ignavibacteriales bacterium]
MVNKYFQILSIALSILILSRCTESSTEPAHNILPEGISGFTSFQYSLIGTAPIHTQTTMLSSYQNKLYRIGSSAPVQVLDLLNYSWSEIALPDSSYWRWDGAAVTISDSIFIVATSSASNSYDILKLSLNTNSFEHTLVNLPDYFHYPAYCVNQDKIIFFSIKCDSVFEYNFSTSKLLKIAENPFLNSEDINLTLSSGKHLNYFYVFGGYATLPKNLFYRFNLNNNHWELLTIPPILEKKQLQGSSFRDNFLFFCDSVSTYEYNFADSKWYLDTSKVPVYHRNLAGELWQGEWSFSATDTCLYGTMNLGDKVWRISK